MDADVATGVTGPRGDGPRHGVGLEADAVVVDVHADVLGVAVDVDRGRRRPRVPADVQQALARDAERLLDHVGGAGDVGTERQPDGAIVTDGTGRGIDPA